MGLIDRAFGADKNTMLMHRLALHWRMVASHYENFIKKNEPNEQDRAVMAEIQKRSLAICDRAEASIKGFGVVNMEKESFLSEMRELSCFLSLILLYMTNAMTPVVRGLRRSSLVSC